MNPKERVLTALDLREPDRVPTGEFATDHGLIGEVLGRPTYWRAKRRYYEALWDGRRDEVVDGMKRDIVEFTLAMGLDMVPVNAARERGIYTIDIPEDIPEPEWSAA